MAKLMTVAVASAKEKLAYLADSGSGIVYVIDNSEMTDVADKGGKYGVFSAMRRDANGKWERVDYLTDDLLADYSLILDYAEVESLVTEARTSLSV